MTGPSDYLMPAVGEIPTPGDDLRTDAIESDLALQNDQLRKRIIELEAAAEETLHALQLDLDEAVRELADRRQAMRALDREIVQLRAMLAEAERQMGNIRQTFIYRIGETIVSARNLKGMRQLPRRLLALRRAFLEKRGEALGSGDISTRFADRLRYVEDALRLLAAQGLDSALSYVRSAPSRDSEDKTRALLELAHVVWPSDPAKAASLAVEAGSINPLAPRLRSLVLAMFEHGEVDSPALILSSLGETLTTTPADRARRETILAFERQLASPLKFPPKVERRPAPTCVAIVAPQSLPHHLGADSFRAQAVIEAARNAGVNVMLFTGCGYQYPLKAEGQPVERLVGAARIVRLPPSLEPVGVFDRFIPETGTVLAREFMARDVTCVHAMGEPSMVAAACWAARVVGASFTLDVGELPSFGSPSDAGWTSRGRFRSGMAVYAEVLKSADRVIVRSEAVAKAFSEVGIDLGGEIISDLAPSGLAKAAEPVISEIRARIGVVSEKIIGVFENIDDDDGLCDLIDALPLIREVEPDAIVLYLGSGRGAERLRQRAVARDVIDRVRIAPESARRQIADYLSGFHVAAFPKRRADRSGIAAPFELQAALAVGLPVVAVDNAWARDWVIDGVTGVLVKAGDIEGLARAVLEVLVKGDFAKGISRAGCEFVSAKSSPSVVHPRVKSTFMAVV